MAIDLTVTAKGQVMLRKEVLNHFQSATHVADAIRAICAIDAVVTDNPAVDAGVKALLAGGDFADGAIAQQGESLGGRMFVTFDRAAITILGQAGLSAADPAQIVD